MEEYVCIHVYGKDSLHIADEMMERNLAVKAYLTTEINEQYYRKNGKVEVSGASRALVIIVERSRLNEAMDAIKSLNDPKKLVTAYAVPVLSTLGISRE